MAGRRDLILIFLCALMVCAVVTKAHVTGWNDGSRIATIDALTASHTFVIDGSPYERNLGDKIRFRGRTYSDKPPLLSVLGAGVGFALAPLGITLRHQPSLAIYAITLLTVGLWFALGCCYAYAFQRLLGFDRRTAAAVAALTGVGTLALPYATVLVNHVPCGAAALAGCYHAVRAREGARADAVLAGALFGLAYAFDASGVLLAIAGAVLLWGAPLRQWALCVAGGLPFIGLQLAYNLSISGSVIPTVFNSAVWNDPSLPLHAWSSKIFAVFTPAQYAVFAANLLVGSKGLFTFTPLALVIGYGLIRMWHAPGLMRRLAVAISSACVLFFLAVLFLQPDIDAPMFGERRYVDVFFLACVALGPALQGVRGALARAAVRLAIVLSVAVAALGTVAPFAGDPNESGFVFGTVEFAALAHRAPLQAALDVVLLAVAIVLVLRLVALPAEAELTTA